MAQSSFVETHHSKWWLLQTPVASMDSFCVVSRSFPWQIHQSSTKTMNLDVLLKKDCILPWFLCTKRSVLDKPQLNFTKKNTNWTWNFEHTSTEKIIQPKMHKKQAIAICYLQDGNLYQQMPKCWVLTRLLVIIALPFMLSEPLSSCLTSKHSFVKILANSLKDLSKEGLKS